MSLEFTIKGVTLSMSDMSVANQYYEAACTAEYLMGNYSIATERKAMDLGYEVRRLMDKYGYSEEDAIQEVLLECDDEDEESDQ